jgi:uncharacterized phage protein (TIGR02218 family)
LTYAAQEISQADGRPIELFTFELGLQTYRYTSAEDDQVDGGETYTAIPISRSRITQGQETRQATLTIEMPANDAFASRYVTSVPSERAEVTIRQVHRGDGETKTIFSGLVKSVAYGQGKDGRVAQIAVDPPITVTARQIPRFTFRRQCNNVLGDGDNGGSGLCDVDMDSTAYRFVGTVSAQSGLTVTVPGVSAFGAAWFQAGTLATLDGIDARTILLQSGDVLTLHIGFPFPLVGESVVVKAGCAHDPETCSTKFGKFDRYQGFAFVPKRNPFDGLDPEVC